MDILYIYNNIQIFNQIKTIQFKFQLTIFQKLNDARSFILNESKSTLECPEQLQY